MRIVINSTTSINDVRAIKRYCHHLILELDKINSDTEFDLLYMGVSDKSNLQKLSSPNIRQITSKIPGKILMQMWNCFNAPKASWWTQKTYDLIHFPGGLPYIPNKCGKVLSTMHGFSQKYIPEYFNQNEIDSALRNVDKAVAGSDYFITVSETNRDELIESWNVSADKIFTVHLGVSPEFKQYDISGDKREELLNKYSIPDNKFILFVGAIKPHKNIENIIQSYSLLNVDLKKEYKLVLVGAKTEYNDKYLNKIDKLGLSDNIIFVDYIEPGALDLPYLYNMADAFIFPTFYEGWASPPLEAMRCGVPVITSDIPSLRESTFGNALYCDPNDPEEICKKIEQSFTDSKLRTQLVGNGLKISSECTWEKCTRSTFDVYNKLIIH